MDALLLSRLLSVTAKTRGNVSRLLLVAANEAGNGLHLCIDAQRARDINRDCANTRANARAITA